MLRKCRTKKLPLNLLRDRGRVSIGPTATNRNAKWPLSLISTLYGVRSTKSIRGSHGMGGIIEAVNAAAKYP